MLRRLLDMVLVLVLLGVPFVFMFTYTGPFQWLAELQLSLAGSYEESLTLVFTLLIWLGFCALIKLVVAKALGKPYKFAILNRGDEASREMINRMMMAAFVVTPVVMAVIAGCLELAYRRTPATPVHMKLADLIAGKAPPSRYLTIDDAQSDSNLDHGITEESNANSATHYLPLLPDGYKPGMPIHAFVEIPGSKMGDLNAHPESLFTGVAAFTRLPGMVRVSFARDQLPPASGYILLRYGETPEAYHKDAEFFLILAGVFLGIGGLIGFRQYRQWKNARAVPLGPPALSDKTEVVESQ